MRVTCADVLLFPSDAGGMQYPRPMAILWEDTARHIERALRHDDVTRQIIIKELQSALDAWMCLTWQDLVEEAALRTWEEVLHNIFLRMAKSGDVCKMGVPDKFRRSHRLGALQAKGIFFLIRDTSQDLCGTCTVIILFSEFPRPLTK